VHERVTAKDERVVVDMGDGSAGGSADMRQTYSRLRVGADAAEVRIVKWRAHGLVESRAETLTLRAIAARAGAPLLEVGVGGGVPGNPEAVDVVDAVAGGEEVVGVFEIGWVVRDELWEIVLVNLVGERVAWGDEAVFQEGRFCRRDVREPAAHLVSTRVISVGRPGLRVQSKWVVRRRDSGEVK